MSATGSLPYVPYLNLVETIVCVICRLVTIYTMSKVVYHRFLGTNKYPRVRIVSPMVIMFLSISVCCALTTLPYYLYTMVKWSPANTYDVTAMYWLGMHLSNSLAVLPALIFFLTLDRCLALKLPLLYSRQMYKWTAVNATIITVLLYVLSMTFSLLELPLQYSKVKTCSVFSCIVLKFNMLPQFIYKVGFGTANLLLTIYFLWVTRSSACEKSIKNSIVKFTLVTEICFNLLPGYVTLLFPTITGEPLAKYIGLSAALFVAIDSALCGMYYLIMLSRKNAVESFNSEIMY
ncbi:hypothetical protein DdX_21596 [Ditylenchus destructor]|uniref:G-protein coupled receptors family 1 profile domain-containing protein n=1 Tax=Ditylenchus destructor TaxID=166010 RepID=A0AAD4MEP6_9BILA|nr:hypothetical protein DdX_21596 [Ditylenchus destructor]